MKNSALADDGTWWDTDTKSMDVLVPERETQAPYFLVPDNHGDYTKHVVSKPKRKLGF